MNLNLSWSSDALHSSAVTYDTKNQLLLLSWLLMTFDSTVHLTVMDRLSVLNRKDYRHVFIRAFAPQPAIEPP